MNKYTVEVCVDQGYHEEPLRYLLHVEADDPKKAMETGRREVIRDEHDEELVTATGLVYPGFVKKAIVDVSVPEVKPLEKEAPAKKAAFVDPPPEESPQTHIA